GRRAVRDVPLPRHDRPAGRRRRPADDLRRGSAGRAADRATPVADVLRPILRLGGVLPGADEIPSEGPAGAPAAHRAGRVAARGAALLALARARTAQLARTGDGGVGARAMTNAAAEGRTPPPHRVDDAYRGGFAVAGASPSGVL